MRETATGVFSLLLVSALLSGCIAAGRRSDFPFVQLERDAFADPTQKRLERHFDDPEFQRYDRIHKEIAFSADATQTEKVLRHAGSPYPAEEVWRRYELLQLPPERIFEAEYGPLPTEPAEGCELRKGSREARLPGYEYLAGGCRGGLAHGLGKLTYERGANSYVILGRFEEGRLVEGVRWRATRDGQAIPSERTEIFVGTFSAGAKAAEGSKRTANGNVFLGRWDSPGGRLQGFAVWLKRSDIDASPGSAKKLPYIYYAGTFREGKLDGFGIRNRKPRASVDGAPHAVGLAWYVGDFENGKRNGRGSLDWVSSSHYFDLGRYKEGRREGLHRWERWTKLWGAWRSKEPFRTHTVFYGEWVKGKAEGRRLCFTRSGKFGTRDEWRRYARWESVCKEGKCVDAPPLRKKSGSGTGLAKALIIGAGAAGIASADIDAEAKVEIAGAYAKDVMTDGKAGALDDVRQGRRATSASARQTTDPDGPTDGSGAAAPAPAPSGPHPLVGWWELVGVACPAKIRFRHDGTGELRGFDCEDSCPGGVRLHFRWQATASPSGIATLTFTVFDVCGKRSTTPPRPREGEILHGVENEVVYALPMLSPAQYDVETANGTYGRWTIERVR